MTRPTDPIPPSCLDDDGPDTLRPGGTPADADLESLLPFTTHIERQTIEQYIRLGGYRAVAEHLGIPEASVRRRVSVAKRRAAARGWAPAHDMTKTAPAGFSVRGVSTLYNADGKVSAQWVKTKQDDDTRKQAWLEAIADVVQPFRGTAELVEPPRHADGDLCVVVPWGDPHAGMLVSAGETGLAYDLDRWEDDILRHHAAMISKAPDAGVGVLANLGDLFHTNNAKNRTEKSGHPLDVSDMWGDVYRAVMQVQRQCIEMMRRKFRRTHVINVRGNHDPEASVSLSMAWEMVYENCADVTISTSEAWFHYFRFGTNLLGFCHGDKTTTDRLVTSMAVDRRKDWADTTYQKWYLGHVHHQEMDEVGCVYVQRYGTLAPPDSHAHSAGYRSNRTICMDVLHRDEGLINSFSNRYKMARAA